MTLERAAQLADILAGMATRIPDNDVPPEIFNVFGAACRELITRRAHADANLCGGCSEMSDATDEALAGCQG